MQNRRKLQFRNDNSTLCVVLIYGISEDQRHNANTHNLKLKEEDSFLTTS